MVDVAKIYQDLQIYSYILPLMSMFWASYALLTKKNYTRAQFYLAVCLMVLGIGMIFNFWYDRYAAQVESEILRSINPILSIFCVISVLFYFVTLMRPKKLTKQFALNFFIPAITFSAIFLIIEGIYDNFNSIEGWKALFENRYHPVIILRIIVAVCVLSFEICVFIYILRLYRAHQRFIKMTYSYSENIDLNWILHILILFGAFAICDILWVFNTNLYVKTICNIISFILICRIFWLGSRQDDVPVESGTIKENMQKEENDTCILSFTKQELIKKSLLEYFEKDLPYLNPCLQLQDVAEAIQTNKTYLSQMINHEFQINFYTLVNRYRIQYAIHLIKKSKEEISIDYIFKTAGFKTRSVFYKQFKEETGLSPLNYIKKYKGISPKEA